MKIRIYFLSKYQIFQYKEYLLIQVVQFSIKKNLILINIKFIPEHEKY